MTAETDGSGSPGPVPGPIRASGDAVTITIKVQPRAGRNEVAGAEDGAVKIRLKAPPVDGEANAACIAFLAELLALPKSAVQIVAGMTSRQKVVRVRGLSVEAVQAAIARAVGAGRSDERAKRDSAHGRMQ